MNDNWAKEFVKEKLQKYKPQIGDERENKNADIYLKEIDKGVNVRWASFREEEGRFWSWGLGDGEQIKNKGYDYYVLVACDENRDVKHCFVFTYDEMSKLEPRNGGMFEHKYYITFYDGSGKYNDALACDPNEKSELERDLNENSGKYDNKWDRIK